MIKQVWTCPKCERIYESPIVVTSIECSNRHPRTSMKWTSGQAPRVPQSGAVPSRQSRPKAERATAKDLQTILKEVKR